jgi:superfamily II DNA/RNA helicase
MQWDASSSLSTLRRTKPMRELDGYEAFEALLQLLGGTSDNLQFHCRPPSLERFRLALCEESKSASTLDLVILLRQVLRYEHGRRNYVVAPTILISHPRLAQFDRWDLVGLDVTWKDGQAHVTALPWKPSWMPQSDELGVEAYATSEVTCRAFNTVDSEGDPFLFSVGRTSYRSPGQRAAVRAALSTPAGGTLVVALPTGEGKSMIFQLAHRVGFVGTGVPEKHGVTLVIVPTVALGINHEQEAVAICGLSKPLAFQGGNDLQNAVIAERIADGSQGLCFASPEAACDRLREPLRRAAEAGHLRALVIDEAHLVDQWGTGFRTEFQELSGLRRELIAAASPKQRMRTILLSATLTDSSIETLRSLFGTDGAFECLAAVQLRPEPDYWIAPVTDSNTRIERVMEALYHVPRPAVLYVTQVDDANAWYERLRAGGFGRVRKLHGDTSRQEREDIVARWRDGLLDVVVGTSAFGLGIDYPHARAVLHACVPETLDRFYQEVGRGGRDGKAALSLIVPTQSDFAAAQSINRERVITVGRGLERWTTMFLGKLARPNGRIVVRIDGRPGTAERDIDMHGERNTDWNLRTLTLMARAGLVRLLGSPYPRVQQVGDWLELEIIDDGHLHKAVWQQRVELVRREVWEANERNLELMRKFLGDSGCPAQIFEELYGADRVGLTCSRCRICRVEGAVPCLTTHVGEPRAPWSLPLHPAVERLLDSDGRLLVSYDPNCLTIRSSRRLSESLQLLQQAQLIKLLLLGSQPFDMDRVLKFADRVPFFVSRVPSLAYSRLPRGPEIVMIGPGQRLEEQNLAVRPEVPRIFVASLEQAAPDGRRLRDVFGGRTLTLDEFHARVAQ